MRWRLVAVAVILMGVFGAQTAHASVIQMTPNNIGLVGYWSFNEGTSTIAHDFSGNGNNGTLSGSTLPTWVSGKLGSGLQFTSANSDRVSLGTAGIPGGNSNYTIAAWIKTSSMGTYGIVGWGQWNTGNAVNALRLNSNGIYNYWWSNDLFCSITTLGDNEWHYILAEFNGTTRSIYVDGTFCNSDTPGSSHNAVVTDVNIGRTNTTEYFPGSIDEVRIYNRALSATEVAALYQSGLAKLNSSQSPGTLANGLVGWWTMDGADTVWSSATAGTEADKSGNGNTGTLTNMSRATSPVIGKIGQALTFVRNTSSATGYVQVADSTSLENSAASSFSVAFWLKPSINYADGANGNIIEKATDSSNTGWGIYRDAGDNLKVRLSCHAGTGGCIGGVDVALGNYSTYFATSTWAHVVLVVNKNTNFATWYLNGVQTGTPGNISSVSSMLNTQPLDIGAGAEGYGVDTFGGAIDDVRIYNRALSASEVQQLYNLGAGTHVNTSSANLQNGSTLSQGLVGLWTFDGSDISGSTVYDLSGNGNNGTNNGATPTIGKLGQALKFNGSSYVGTNLDIQPSAIPVMTFTVWVKPGSSVGNEDIFTDDDGGYDRGLESSRGDGNFNIFTGSGSWAPVVADIGKWQFVVVEYTATNILFYKNGVQYSLGSAPTTGTTAAKLNIGRSPTYGEYYNGSIDDVRIYNRALSASEVQYLYNMGK
jgi:hypothetical protein